MKSELRDMSRTGAGWQDSYLPETRLVERSGAIEITRCVAMAMIVAFHQGILPGGGFVGVTVFLALSIGLIKPKKLASAASSRFSQLILPWIFWSLAYSALKIAYAIVAKKPLGDEFSWSMLLYGSMIHLWFLPFLFVATVGVQAIMRAGLLRPAHTAGMLLLGIVLVCAIPSANVATPYQQWLSGIPGVLMGCVYLSIKDHPKRSEAMLLFCGLVLTFATGAWLIFGGAFVALCCVIAAGILTLTWLVESLPASPRLLKVSELTFGVYLIHPLFLKLFQPWLGQDSIALTVCVIVASAASAQLLRFTTLKWTVGLHR